MEIQSIAEKALAKAKSNGADQTLVMVSSTVAKEFNIESNKLTLLRTTFDQNLGVKTLIDTRQGSTSGNQFAEDAISSVAEQATSAAKASPQDKFNGFAPSQGHKDFSFGDLTADAEWMHSRLVDLLKDRERFPKIIIEGSTIKFVKTEKVLATSEGTLLSARQGHYVGFVMFTAKDGKQSSSFNYIDFSLPTKEAGKPVSLMKLGSLEELLDQSSGQTKVQKVPAKFEGDVIVTPYCMTELIGAWSSFLTGDSMLKGSSFFKDKIGQQVASPLWSLSSHPTDSNFASRKFWTGDGYLTKNESIFENGVLKNYLLNHYAAIKLNQKVSQSGGDYLKLAAGQTALQDMIKSVKKGVLMCRYSSGRPAENGDISGVAKNSYYIENGEIKFPLGETMVSMNLEKMLKDIQSVSKETISSGHWEMPWVKFSGAGVS